METALLEEAMANLILIVNVCVELVNAQIVGTMFDKEIQCQLTDSLSTVFFGNDNAYFGTAMVGVEVAEIDDAGHLLVGCLNHQAELTVGVEVVLIGLDVLLQKIAGIWACGIAHLPQRGGVLKTHHACQIFRLGGTKQVSVFLKQIHRAYSSKFSCKSSSFLMRFSDGTQKSEAIRAIAAQNNPVLFRVK